MRTIIAALALVPLVAPARADGLDPKAFGCHPLAVVKADAEAAGARFVTMTPQQWEFARGIAAIIPQTPDGLPPGDRGALLIGPDGDGALIFIDGDQACEGVEVHKPVIDLELQVGGGDVIHVGKGT